MTLEDLDRFVARDAELALFDALLRRGDGARVLALHAESGSGTSVLLRQLRRRCRTELPRVPVGLVDFKEFRETSPLALVRALHKDLTTRSPLAFPEFGALDAELRRDAVRGTGPSSTAVAKEFESAGFDDDPREGDRPARRRARPGVRLLNLLKTRLSENDLRMLCFELGFDADNLPDRGKEARALALVEHYERRGALAEIADALAEQRPDLRADLTQALSAGPERQPAVPLTERAVDAFFQELRRYADERPTVLLLDHFERWYEPADPALRTWFENYLFERHFLGEQPGPRHLLLVLAGTRLPNFYQDWPRQLCDRSVERHTLAPFDGPLFAECLRRQCPGISQEDVERLRPFHTERNVPLLQIISFAQSFVGSRS
jgi:hypothetical protein